VPPDRAAGDRLESWKEIAGYLRRDVTTVQRWERREGMPVHRHHHDKAGSVYAFRAELDAWVRSRRGGPPEDPAPGASDFTPAGPDTAGTPAAGSRGRRRLLPVALIVAVLVTALALWYSRRREQSPPETLLTDARFLPLTNFGGNEQAAAISRDGRFVAFLSNREGAMDVWVTQIGTGRFYNLTKNSARELLNPSVRTLGFSPDGTQVTFWARTTDGAGQAVINIWGIPVLGGSATPYLEGVAEFDWSADGSRLVYHTPGPGDPMFVRDSGQDARKIFSAPPGLHGHFPVWSPDQRFIYFVQGSLPDHMDIWRIAPTGGNPERITHHEARVSHPVFVDAHTLAYLSSDTDDSGQWLHTLDLERREPRRVGFGLERYTSISASADGRRLVATVAGARSALWRLTISGTPGASSALRPVSLTTGSGSSPRLGPGYLLYVSSKGESDSIWKLEADKATEVWTGQESRIIGAPAIARDGGRIAFSVRQKGQTSLFVANADGTSARIVTSTLTLQGTPAWSPDGQSITVSAVVDGAPRLFAVTVDGRSSAPLVKEHAVDPAWSPDGEIAVYSGADVGTTFPVKAITRAGTPSPLPGLTLSRGSRRLAFMPEGRSLVFLRGDIGHKNLWSIDLRSGAERQLTNFGPDFTVRDFDVSPDGRELIIEQLQERSDITLIELPPAKVPRAHR
jgi:Tol biopolymer transport system component